MFLFETEGEQLKDLLNNSTISDSRFVDIYKKLAGIFGSAYETILTVGWSLVFVCFTIAIVGIAISRDQRAIMENKQWAYKLLAGAFMLTVFQAIISFAYMVGSTVGR